MRELIAQLCLDSRAFKSGIFRWLSIVAFRMRHQYKLFGVSADVDKWQVPTRSDLGDVYFPLCDIIALLDAKKTRAKDILP